MTDITIILPCLNEERALPHCLDEIEKTVILHNLDAEVLIIDNGSTDRSVSIVQERINLYRGKNPQLWKGPQIRLLHEGNTGYGSAYQKGFEHAKGTYIFMADSDGTYEFKDIPLFIDTLKSGADLVVGNRFAKIIEKESMPWLHKYIGNPFLSFLVKTFFNVKIHDIHSGIRAITKEAHGKMTLYTRGMEFASEMIIKAARNKLIIREIPVTYRPRIGESKLRSFIDGWRHLRFILLYSPLLLFMLPGLILFTVGFISLLLLYFFQIKIFAIQLYIHPMFYSSLATILGYQLISFAAFSKVYAITHLGDTDEKINRLFKYINLERATLVGILITLVGLSIYAYIFATWIKSNLGDLNQIKNSIVALTCVVIGIQTFFSAFMFSIIGIKER